jgi:transitional endoplasmic reticulum ATPase
MPMELIDTVPELSRKHFEEGLKFARSSVTKQDLEKYEQFRRKFDPGYSSRSVTG